MINVLVKPLLINRSPIDEVPLTCKKEIVVSSTMSELEYNVRHAEDPDLGIANNSSDGRGRRHSRCC